MKMGTMRKGRKRPFHPPQSTYLLRLQEMKEDCNQCL